MRKLKKNGFTPLETIQGPTPQKKRRFLTGFTLVEILASVLLMTVVIVPFITFSADNLAMNLEISRRVQCLLVMETELERMKQALRTSYPSDFKDTTEWPTNLGKLRSDYNHYLVTRTATEVSTTLLIIGLSGGYDTDKNGALGTDEIMVTWNTQYAKRS